MAIITIDTDQIIEFSKQAGNLVIKKEADEYLYKLLTLQVLIEQAINNAKNKIEEDACRIDPNFKTINGNKTRAMSRVYGYKYAIDPSTGEKATEDGFATKEVKFRAVTDKIEEFMKEKGQLPLGVQANIRKRTTSLSLKNNEKTQG